VLDQRVIVARHPFSTLLRSAKFDISRNRDYVMILCTCVWINNNNIKQPKVMPKCKGHSAMSHSCSDCKMGSRKFKRIIVLFQVDCRNRPCCASGVPGVERPHPCPQPPV
jgi:hypothetical protein